MWFTDSLNGIIGRITLDGAVTEFPLESSLSSPYAITVGPDANLWFLEPGVDAIGRLTVLVHNQLTDFPVPGFGVPTDLVTGPDGNLWFTIDNPAPNLVAGAVPRDRSAASLRTVR